MKPILFNTDMVRAILDGRKTVTRRVVKPQPLDKPMVFHDSVEGMNIVCHVAGRDVLYNFFPPYQPADTLYVRETWYKDPTRYMYKANYSDTEKFFRDGKEVQIKWRPSIHMPKEAARLFLRVTDVRVERLQDISKDPPGSQNQVVREGFRYECDFIATWQNTMPRKDWPVYGWFANPYVWVIEFERVSKEAALEGGKDYVE